MLFVENLFKVLKKNKVNFFSGVPDSILKNFSIYLEKKKLKNIVAANEGSAVSIGIGSFLEKKKISCVYLQNSGLGNAVNPLASIAHKDVYSIPLILLIGWRGAPKTKDEPQHLVKGRITTKILKLLKIRYCQINTDKDLKKFDKLIMDCKKKNLIVAGLIKDKSLSFKNELKKKINKKKFINQRDFFKNFLNLISKNSKIITSTGYTSRGLMKLRNTNSNSYKGRDFYMIGGMGHTAMVSLGVSIFSKKKVYCIDGDGSLLMHMGSMHRFAINGNKNLKHVLLNNDCHNSVGGQKTQAMTIDFKKLSLSLGYKKYFKIKSKKDLRNTLKQFIKSKGPSFLEVLTDVNMDKNLPRPTDLIKIKNRFYK